MESFINIDNNVETMRPEMRYAIRKEIAKDTLDTVNRNSVKFIENNGIYLKYIKRIIDIIFAGIALLITLPINLVLAVCTYFDVGRPIFYKGERVGKDEKQFILLKFRNMNNKKDQYGNLLLGRDRVTRLGRFVRKTSLDELLNFWSILKGDMSVIGPRPLPDAYTEFMSDRHRKRYAVRPGLECPMLNNVSRNSWADQFENDVWYAENVSFLVDVKMILALVKMVFNKRSRKTRSAAIRGSFMGYTFEGASINSQSVPKEYVVRAQASRNEADNNLMA